MFWCISGKTVAACYRLLVSTKKLFLGKCRQIATIPVSGSVAVNDSIEKVAGRSVVVTSSCTMASAVVTLSVFPVAAGKLSGVVYSAFLERLGGTPL